MIRWLRLFRGNRFDTANRQSCSARQRRFALFRPQRQFEYSEPERPTRKRGATTGIAGSRTQVVRRFSAMTRTFELTLPSIWFAQIQLRFRQQRMRSHSARHSLCHYRIQ